VIFLNRNHRQRFRFFLFFGVVIKKLIHVCIIVKNKNQFTENITMSRLSTLLLCALLFFVSTAIVPAETMYIRTVVKITLRTGPGSDHKIIAMISSGDPIEVLETDGAWSKIRTEDGKEGWIMTNLITDEKPSQYLPVAGKSGSAPSVQDAKLLEENKSLKTENMKLGSDLTASKNELAQLRATMEELKTASSSYEKKIAELKTQSEKARTEQGPMTNNEFRQNIWWFLIGAGIIIIGFIVGYNVRRPRTRSLLR